MVRKTWLLLIFSLFFLGPLLSGCSSQVDQESAREQVEREDAEAPDAEDAPGDDES